MIYFIQDEGSLFIKIGFTDVDAVRRMGELQVGCPCGLMLLKTIEGGKEVEANIHERFAYARERGEWFRPVPEILLFLLSSPLCESNNRAYRRFADLAVTGSLQTAIIEHLKGKPLLSVNDIAFSVNANPESVRTALYRLTQRGVVRREGKLYASVEDDCDSEEVL